jgi:hypothetical protein
VQLRVELGDRQLDLGERIHHYLLTTLARLRLRDAPGLTLCSNEAKDLV